MNRRWLKQWSTSFAWITAVTSAAGMLSWSPALAAPPVVQGVDSAAITQEFNLTQSQANRLSIFHDYDLSVIGTSPGATNEIPADPNGGGLLAPTLGDWAQIGDSGLQRNWFVSATAPIVGYDSNPQALNSARSSPFLGADITTAYSLAGQLPNGNPWGATFAYDAVGAFYRGETKEAAGLEQTASIRLTHSLAHDTIRLEALADDQFTATHGKSFLNSIDIHPATQFFFTPNLSIETAYQYTHFDYFFPLLIKQQDPDASRNVASVALHLFPLPQPAGSPVPDSPDVLTDILRRSLRSATIGYDHTWNLANGTDYNYESSRIRFGLDTIRFLPTDAVTADFQYAREWQNYTNFNTGVQPLLAGRTERRRSDHLDVFTTRLNARLADLAHDRGTLGAFFQWDVVWDRSNILERDFNEYIVSTGITYRY